VITGLATTLVTSAGLGCGRFCPPPPDPAVSAQTARIQSEEVWTVRVEVLDEAGRAIHLAEGPLKWDGKQHLGGSNVQGVKHDAPDYEVRATLISPEEIWTST